MEKLIEALRSGSYRIGARRAAGIHYNTLLAWEKKGESQKSGEYVEFLGALRVAEAEAATTNVEVITRAAQNGDWRAAARFLEHKYPDKRARLDKRADQDQDGNFEVNVNFVPVRKQQDGERNRARIAAALEQLNEAEAEESEPSKKRRTIKLSFILSFFPKIGTHIRSGPLSEARTTSIVYFFRRPARAAGGGVRHTSRGALSLIVLAPMGLSAGLVLSASAIGKPCSNF